MKDLLPAEQQAAPSLAIDDVLSWEFIEALRTFLVTTRDIANQRAATAKLEFTSPPSAV